MYTLEDYILIGCVFYFAISPEEVFWILLNVLDALSLWRLWAVCSVVYLFWKRDRRTVSYLSKLEYGFYAICYCLNNFTTLFD